MKVNGYRTLIINEQEAVIVRLIFDLFVNKRYSPNAICKYLESLSIPKPGKGKNHQKINKSKLWNRATIYKILKNPVYVGRWFYNKRQRIKGKNGKTTFIPRPKAEWLLVEVPPIINEEIFKAAQDETTERNRLASKFHKHDYLLSSMLKCGCCGSSLCGTTYRKNQYYRCIVRLNRKRLDYKECDSPTFRTDKVETAIWQWIKSILLDEDTLREDLKDYKQQQEERRRPFLRILETNKAKLSSLENERSRLIKAYQAGVLSLDDLSREKLPVDREIETLARGIEKLEAEIKPEDLQPINEDEIIEYAARIRKGGDLADDNFAVKRKLFELLRVKAVLTLENGEKWADVTCVLGEQHLSTENYTTFRNLITNIQHALRLQSKQS